MSLSETVEAYYQYLDEHRYDALETILAGNFVQKRPDRTFASRETFLQFMKSDRPVQDTSHKVERIFEGPTQKIAVRGCVLKPDGSKWFEFLDVFSFDGNQQIEKLCTMVPA